MIMSSLMSPLIAHTSPTFSGLLSVWYTCLWFFFFFLLVGTLSWRKSAMVLNFPSAEYFCLLNIFLRNHHLVDHFPPATCVVTSAAEDDVEDSIATPSVVHRMFSLRQKREVVVVIRHIACWDQKLIWFIRIPAPDISYWARGYS